jgi:hypothetical protein
MGIEVQSHNLKEVLLFNGLLYVSVVNAYEGFYNVLSNVAKLFEKLNFNGSGNLSLEVFEASCFVIRDKVIDEVYGESSFELWFHFVEIFFLQCKLNRVQRGRSLYSRK